MDFLFVIIVLIMSVVIHEVSHGFVALALGDPTAKYQGRLTLNPFNHLDPVGSVLVPLIGYFAGGFIIGWAKPVPFNPYNLRPEKWGLPAQAGEALVAVAGPVSNIVIALIFGLLIRLGDGASFMNESFLSLASFVVLINITLAIFNLIPIPPLDGSKILFAVLPLKWQGIRNSLENSGLILVFIFIFFLWPVISPLAFYLFRLFTGLAF